MSKNEKKNRHRRSAVSRETNASASGRSKRRLGDVIGSHWKLALLMFGILAVLGFLYYFLLSRYIFWVTPALYISAAVLFLLFYFVNRGFSSKPVTPDMLPDDWTQEQKRSFCEDDVNRKHFARKIMILLVPVLMLAAFDILYLNIFPILKG